MVGGTSEWSVILQAIRTGPIPKLIDYSSNCTEPGQLIIEAINRFVLPLRKDSKDTPTGLAGTVAADPDA